MSQDQSVGLDNIPAFNCCDSVRADGEYSAADKGFIGRSFRLPVYDIPWDPINESIKGWENKDFHSGIKTLISFLGPKTVEEVGLSH